MSVEPDACQLPGLSQPDATTWVAVVRSGRVNRIDLYR
jgi:hypothetical protein